MKVVTVNGSLVRTPVRQRGGTFAFATIMVKTLGSHGTVEKEPIDLIFPDPFVERILSHGKPGMTILVNGREHLKTYTKRDKSMGTINEIFVTSLEMGVEGD